jgi:hypothetical protein
VIVVISMTRITLDKGSVLPAGEACNAAAAVCWLQQQRAGKSSSVLAKAAACWL